MFDGEKIIDELLLQANNNLPIVFEKAQLTIKNLTTVEIDVSWNTAQGFFPIADYKIAGDAFITYEAPRQDVYVITITTWKGKTQSVQKNFTA